MHFNPVQVTFFVPPLEGDEPRLASLFSALEATLPGTELIWRAEETESPERDDDERWMAGAGVRLVRTKARDRWAADQLRRGQGALLFSGPARPGVSVSIERASPLTPRSGQPVGTVVLMLPEDTLEGDVLPGVLTACGDALHAWCAPFMPFAAASVLMPVQMSLPGRVDSYRQGLIERNPALEALPRLPGGIPALPTAEAPPSLGWLNYWSVDTARWLGFPDEARDGEWLARSVRTPAGAWLVRLTDEVFDVQRPEHLEALDRAYRRFERIAAHP